MAEFTANAVQTVAANQNILFTETPVKGNCSIVHREGSGLVTARGITNQCRARFRVFFSGNITIPAGGTLGPISVSIAINGETVPSTTMIFVPTVLGNFGNVSSAVFIDVPAGCCTQISVKNTSNVTINTQNANLIVERVA